MPSPPSLNTRPSPGWLWRPSAASRFDELHSAHSAVDETVADDDNTEIAEFIVAETKRIRSANRPASAP